MHCGRKKSKKLEIQKQSEDSIIENIRNPSKLKKGNEAIKGRIIRDIKKRINTNQ